MTKVDIKCKFYGTKEKLEKLKTNLRKDYVVLETSEYIKTKTEEKLPYFIYISLLEKDSLRGNL